MKAEETCVLDKTVVLFENNTQSARIPNNFYSAFLSLGFKKETYPRNCTFFFDSVIRVERFSNAAAIYVNLYVLPDKGTGDTIATAGYYISQYVQVNNDEQILNEATTLLDIAYRTLLRDWLEAHP
ncbi:hypothetical protein GCM10008957_32720 [Deinococcus ruber]|uniref:Uncharacterized protein n=1 Tax=Deinococcus ruber TaxID=1848197 RepID=A0A918CCH9_9DEIO|nr:hypothetical protein GCM10008957_32720 [Deinococcus ruber]